MTNNIINLVLCGVLFSSVISITFSNPIISIIFLITTFVQAACYLILIGINFIGISYIVIYVGAIAVLFLFIIMMIHIKLTDILDTGNNYTKNLPLGLTIVSLFIFVLFSILPYTYNNISFSTVAKFSSTSCFQTTKYSDLIKSETIEFSTIDNLYFNIIKKLNPQIDVVITHYPQMEVLGHNLYTYGAILLIILSLILLLSMLAIIVISKHNKNI
uniref:NADH-ubiquinone oxidoreductase chain 6 n=1 Tax=Cyclocybe aegerita TaxID=1973307 RepID=A0A343S8H5_CYCAE|nr:NADH dehydrogenase subunit 6 [Cyclocybe aegerita]YP_010146962.1 NADH dehydrogenase subunit 6 [Cyclocybe aegerita]AUN44950.1 NADH dehydrogenase subunit 6 [Cyclocybe aegerita]AUN44951.1 NADH dehydrogenase subunit 6 [Cyclocybe aegerita]QQP21447.1 NADH dehydrogenase subunit 6 [Cyclocybe aegerita]QQP21471.1 NADH dehydrogenase subunit 6 [Cyclocybe aegerita]